MEVLCMAVACIWYQVMLLELEHILKHLFAFQGDVSAFKILCLNL